MCLVVIHNGSSDNRRALTSTEPRQGVNSRRMCESDRIMFRFGFSLIEGILGRQRRSAALNVVCLDGQAQSW